MSDTITSYVSGVYENDIGVMKSRKAFESRSDHPDPSLVSFAFETVKVRNRKIGSLTGDAMEE